MKKKHNSQFFNPFEFFSWSIFKTKLFRVYQSRVSNRIHKNSIEFIVYSKFNNQIYMLTLECIKNYDAYMTDKLRLKIL